MKKRIRQKLALGAWLMVASAPITSVAAVKTWSGNTDGDWATGANWGGAAPVAGDSLTFDAAGTSGTALGNTLTGGLNIAGITFNATAASYTMGGNAFTLGGNITNNATGGAEVLNHNLTLSATRSVTVASNAALTLGGVVSSSGAFGLTKLSAGSLTLSGANTYTGVTTLTGGTTNVNTLANGGAASSVGQSSSGAANLVFNGGTLAYTGGTATTDRLFTLQSNGAINSNGSGALTFSNSGALAFSGATATQLTLGGTNTADNTFAIRYADNGATLQKLVKAGAGKWVVTNASNSYSNGTTINAGTLAFSAGALGTAGAITMNGGTLQWNGVNTQDVSSRITMVAAKSAGFDTNGNDVTFANAIGGGLSASLVKTGAGTLTLSGANTYTGATTVSAGILKLAAGATLASGALSGTGVFDGAMTVAGTLQGGAGAVGGTLTVTNGTITLASNSVISLALDGALAHSTLAAGSGGGFVFQSNQSFNFQDLGAVAGTYTNLITGASSGENVSGWTIANAGWTGAFVNDGAGNISLNLTAVPEPSTYGLVGAGALAAVAFVRRRRPARCGA